MRKVLFWANLAAAAVQLAVGNYGIAGLNMIAAGLLTPTGKGA
ncbi:hypothetical protein [Roseivivax isoporae]|nr:hypothetical protein [Roseivivax isoporae]